MSKAQVQLPPKLIPVFTSEATIRGAYGGRGSAKTRSFAKMAAVQAYQRSMMGESGIILCAREFMNSLDESSMAEVKAAIESEEWLKPHFEIGEKYIRTRNRRVEFKFAGLRHNLDSIKSKARILVLWVDEAEPVSQTAWDKVLPTVREDGSEIWVTWNPEIENSATDTMFRKHPPDDAHIIEMNWEDNPWFPNRLRQQMEWDRRRDPEKYEHIWGGGYAMRSDTRVFTNWKIEEFETPDDVERFYFGADWGYSVDPSVLIRMWISKQTIYIDYEAYAVKVEIDNTPALFAGDCPFPENDSRYWKNPNNYEGVPGAIDGWPITADSARPETISYMRRAGFNIKSAKKGPNSVMDGIEFLRSYDIVIHPRCRNTIDEFTHYRWKTDPNTDEVLPVLNDKDNHVIDAARYALEGTRKAKPKQSLNMVPDAHDPSLRGPYG